MEAKMHRHPLPSEYTKCNIYVQTVQEPFFFFSIFF